MIVRRKFSLAGSEAEKLSGTFARMNDLPMEHHIRSFNRAGTIVRRREYGYRTVAYPGGVLKVYEVVGGKIPLQHRVHPEGLEAYYVPEIIGPPDFAEPLILSNTYIIPPLATNFAVGPPFPFTVPIGREAALKQADFQVSDASIATIRFQIVISNIKTLFAQSVVVSAFQRWETPERLEEQTVVAVQVTSTLPGFREVRIALNGWIYPVKKRTS
jgi:hypothetical protein